MPQSIISFAATALSAGWLITQPAVAQNQPATPSPADAATSNVSISDKKLDQTAAAIENVQRVHTDYQQKLSNAAPDQQGKIISEANSALEKAVTDQGLSPDEYNSIIKVAQNDPNVRQELVQRLAAMKEKK